MEQKKRLVTRSDFDGLVCAMMLRELNLIDEIKFDEKKTKNFVNFLDALKVGGKALVVVDEITENIFASARNVGYAKVVTTDNVSVVDLLNVDNLVISKASAKALEEALK